MARNGEFFEARATAGDDYFFRVDGRDRPDPRSRHQPYDVHGPSRLVDPGAFRWTGSEWRGIPLEHYILYELHIGTFTPEGTFDGAIKKLDYLKDLGVTAIEIMPVAEFPGTRNWGYDGTYLYAVADSYGGPDAFKRFIDAAHARGLAVVLDVVYNHLGPEGNYLSEFGPYFTPKHTTLWGDAINYDNPHVRAFLVENALHWFEEYHVDALRLDAVHAIYDPTLLGAIAKATAKLDRTRYLIAECNPEELAPKVLRDQKIDARWNDDFHHALMARFTGRRDGYFGRTDFEMFAPDPSVIFLQNHDQIANAFQGKRIAEVLTREREQEAAQMMFEADSIPLLFMGQEFGSKTPFDYFVDFHDPALIQAVREGRRKEYEQHLQEGEDFHPPDVSKTFLNSKLDWDAVDAERLSFYKGLIAGRRKRLEIK